MRIGLKPSLRDRSGEAVIDGSREHAGDLDLPRLQAQDHLPAHRSRETWRERRRQRKTPDSGERRAARQIWKSLRSTAPSAPCLDSQHKPEDFEPRWLCWQSEANPSLPAIWLNAG